MKNFSSSLKIIFLTVFVATASLCSNAQTTNGISVKDAGQGIQYVSADETFGDQASAVSFAAYITNYSAYLDLLVVTRKDNALASNGNSQSDVVEFTFSNGNKAKFIASTDDMIHYSFALSEGTSSSCPYDMMNTEISKLMCFYMNLLTTSNIKTVRINNLDIAIDEPTAKLFDKMFRAGINNLSDKSYYTEFMNRKSTNGSRNDKSTNNTYRPKTVGGSLSAFDMISNVFGFIEGAPNAFAKSYIYNQSKLFDWCKIYDPQNTTFCIISVPQATIPFDYNGVPITVMTAYFHDNATLSSYNYKISRLKTEMTQDQATQVAESIVSELSQKGITFTEGRKYAYDFYRMEGKYKGWKIEIQASESSRAASLDSYGITVSTNSL